MKSETNIPELKTKPEFKNAVRDFTTRNMVTILFVVMALAGFIVSGMSPMMFLMDIISRVSRNAFLVLSLIIPV
ncbi:MAG TPA: hypothetical protein VFD91_15815, partial [Mariniphaga sp.]|nr:hypothetical protein [Mariniphaga sp.]